MTSLMQTLQENLIKSFGADCVHKAHHELTLEVDPAEITAVCRNLRDEPEFKFQQLMDLTVVDYLHYGRDEWDTQEASGQGFDRGVARLDQENTSQSNHSGSWHKPRIAVVYHLLSITHRHRVRVKAFISEADPIIDTVTPIWASANWYEREAFDLFGVLFNGHPDLRRILTDYRFIGHPFRKDFPLVGKVEARYDAAKGRVVYDPVDIEPRILVPKVIRNQKDPEQKILDQKMQGQN